MISPQPLSDLRPYPVEITPPDISAYRTGNTGVDYFISFSGPVTGPHAMVTALMHGNELCGAVVLDELLRSGFRPARGRLSIGFCNVDAFLSFDVERPTLSRFLDEDMNRLWETEILAGGRNTREVQRCRKIQPLLDNVDMLLDIHSMQHPTAPLMLAGPLSKGRSLAESVGVPDTIVVDRGHAAGRRMRDYAHFSDPKQKAAALLVECGQHWASSTVDIARSTTIRFLVATGVADPELIDAWPGNDNTGAQHVIEVTHPITVETNSFKFVESYVGMEVIPKAGTLLGTDGDKPIHTPHDNCVLIMPSRRLRKGQTAVRLGRFLD
ncbi:MAG: succinylglutamate desuccinylase [Rhodospirillaceae bacterium]|nr:succinylglutamate desuccinylase [Rhodospirillaceae bacterium]